MKPRALGYLVPLVGVLFSSSAYAICKDGEDAVPIPLDLILDCSEDGMRCAYWEPQNHDPNTKYPLVVMLNGAGGSGTDGTFNHLLDWNCYLQSLVDPQARANFPAFLMAPRSPNSDNDFGENPNAAAWVIWDWANRESYDITQLAESTSTKTAIKMIGSMQTKYPNIDPDRIYVIGGSMGGYGAWEFISRYPDKFAAGLPWDGGGSPQAAPVLRNMAVWSSHNIDDDVPYDSDKEMFAAVARAGGRPYFTEGVRGNHFGGMQRQSQMGFVPWLFAQRRGIPTRPQEYLTFSPEGGQHPPGPVTITLAGLGADEIRYTTDGTIPSALTDIGTLYTGPFTIDTSAIVIAAAHSGTGQAEITMFHAQPYKLGDIPLPEGADLAPHPPLPPVENPNTGGAPNGTGGAANEPASGGAANSPASGGAVGEPPAQASGGGNGNPVAAAGGGTSTETGARPGSSTRSASGCSVAAAEKAAGRTGFWWLLAGLLSTAAVARRRVVGRVV
jgi:predicted esterase